MALRANIPLSISKDAIPMDLAVEALNLHNIEDCLERVNAKLEQEIRFSTMIVIPNQHEFRCVWLKNIR